ncbi:MAG: bifunctional biotin--[acetyl-CoA-carboxylase] ligase/biotin operon repressor BirA [Gammaproteobacteria bacterium]|jgi:BirA family transcriptional regulator, biotin operon repressor / biotin---[acetyl-CoA-carboxylase] ligase|nr:bifunctional biotin--[acetyl-CoA-carboxylase] ligase/biotin operon repressor BirA [Gammaproteobacteria bacterium]MBT4494117.1 bifunctional biotin--[acetyl-CoA-carboxylase] ligase/biotin operon repressor BirA [Gammaproteobacteria bacterium]MBT7371012.1 bifunctional biotin--[acetyl-CoA-carboxylase] ligase/biotin operon repressor BirA [Gammaproteobacteria bacterium]
MSVERLLKILSDGKFHSGDKLGSDLGVSRAAIWKQLKKVKELNLPLTSIKGKGYQIEGGLDLLSGTEISSNLSVDAQYLLSSIDVEQVVDSTNNLAMTQALARQKGYVCTAEQQTTGRGRHGRGWVSPYGSNLYFSIVWEFQEGVSALDGLSLATGVAIAEALSELGVEDVNLKWPNDVQHAGKKLAGILIEITGDAAGPCQVVLGVGLNVNMPKSASGTIDQPWIDIGSILPAHPTRSHLLAALLNQILPMLQTFEQEGFSAFHKRWDARDALSGRQVSLNLGNEVVTGRVEGVDKSGAIVLRNQEGKLAFRGGEASLHR